MLWRSTSYAVSHLWQLLECHVTVPAKNVKYKKTLLFSTSVMQCDCSHSEWEQCELRNIVLSDLLSQLCNTYWLISIFSWTVFCANFLLGADVYDWRKAISTDALFIIYEMNKYCYMNWYVDTGVAFLFAEYFWLK